MRGWDRNFKPMYQNWFLLIQTKVYTLIYRLTKENRSKFGQEVVQKLICFKLAKVVSFVNGPY